METANKTTIFYCYLSLLPLATACSRLWSHLPTVIATSQHHRIIALPHYRIVAVAVLSPGRLGPAALRGPVPPFDPLHKGQLMLVLVVVVGLMIGVVVVGRLIVTL
jgi:hypothetical protein